MLLTHLPLWGSQPSLLPNTCKQISELGKICSLEVQDCDLAFCPAPFSQDAELHHLMVTAAKVAPNL